jgi:hypothetical protein
MVSIFSSTLISTSTEQNNIAIPNNVDKSGSTIVSLVFKFINEDTVKTIDKRVIPFKAMNEKAIGIKRKKKFFKNSKTFMLIPIFERIKEAKKVNPHVSGKGSN